MAKKHSNLTEAKKAKKDEFYTRLEDIENELHVYGKKCQHFKDKVILLPCDESEHTDFFKHFMMNREDYGWKKLISIGYRTNHPAEVHVVENLADKVVEKNIRIIGDGDFRNDATISLFKEADVIVTNPPFSLFREFIALVMNLEKKFIVIGNQNCISYKEIFPLFRDNKMWAGYSFNKVLEFKVPDGYSYSRIGKDGVKYGRVSGVCWFTNLEIPKRTEIFDTRIDFNYGNSKGWYQKYDNHEAININTVRQIPMDYKGVMGVPITFLDKYNPKQFKIVGFRKGDDGKDLCVNGKDTYCRILIQKA